MPNDTLKWKNFTGLVNFILGEFPGRFIAVAGKSLTPWKYGKFQTSPKLKTIYTIGKVSKNYIEDF